MADVGLPPDRDWLAHYGMTRRKLLAGGGAALGFAAAAQPVMATALSTSADGLDISSTSVAGADGFAVPLYVARPKGNRPAPAVIVVHEVFGVHEWIKDICRRLAHAGYMAVAPDLYARIGDATKVPDFPTLFKTIVEPTPDAQVMSDLDHVAQWIPQHGGASGRIGITGFCWGGRIVWLFAAHSSTVKAGVAFYGRLSGDQALRPIDLAAKLHAPVLGQYGGLDKGIPLSDVEKMQAALKAAGSSSRITVYPKADHGFLADYRPSYDPAAAGTAWKATLDWFHRHI